MIQAMLNEQDMRKMGRLASLLPFTYVVMFIISPSLIGFPFCIGLYSKDVILKLTYTKYTISGDFAFWLGSVCLLYFLSFFLFTFLNFLPPTSIHPLNVIGSA